VTLPCQFNRQGQSHITTSNNKHAHGMSSVLHFHCQDVSRNAPHAVSPITKSKVRTLNPELAARRSHRFEAHLQACSEATFRACVENFPHRFVLLVLVLVLDHELSGVFDNEDEEENEDDGAIERFSHKL